MSCQIIKKRVNYFIPNTQEYIIGHNDSGDGLVSACMKSQQRWWVQTHQYFQENFNKGLFSEVSDAQI